MTLLLSDSLQPLKLAADYARDGHIHIPGLFKKTSAKALHQHLLAFSGWNLALNQGAKSFDIFPHQRAAMTAEQLLALRTAAGEGARAGFQYIYENFSVYDAWHAGHCPEDFMAELMTFLSAEPFLALARSITGHKDIAFADAQLTRFGPGDFLTTHDDNVAGKNRRAAYVISLNPVWRADWGGILNFICPDGHIKGGITPSFNALNLFTVPQSHAVSQIASYAPFARYSITGWLRAGADPMAARQI